MAALDAESDVQIGAEDAASADDGDALPQPFDADVLEADVPDADVLGADAPNAEVLDADEPDAAPPDVAPLDVAGQEVAGSDAGATDLDADDTDDAVPEDATTDADAATPPEDTTADDVGDVGDTAGDAGPTWKTRIVTTTHPSAACQATIVLPEPLTADVAPSAAPWFKARPDIAAQLNAELPPLAPSQTSSVLVVQTPQGFDFVINVGNSAPKVRVVQLQADLTSATTLPVSFEVPKLANCIAQADVDRDGWQDVVCSDRVIRNGPKGLDWSGATSIPLSTKLKQFSTISIAVADILPAGVGDGWPDLLMTEWGGDDRAYQGGKSGFVDVTQSLGLVSGAVKLSWGFGLFDADGDGKKEILQMPDGGAQTFAYHWLGNKLDWYDTTEDLGSVACSKALGYPNSPPFLMFSGLSFLSPMGLTVAYDAGDTQLIALGLAIFPNAWFACAAGSCRRVGQALGLASPAVAACLCGKPPLACPSPGPSFGPCSEALNPLGVAGKPRGANGTTMVGWTTLLRDLDGDGFEDLIELYGDDPGHSTTTAQDAANFPAIFGDQASRPVSMPTVRRGRNDGTFAIVASAGLDAVGHYTNAVWLHVAQHDLLLLGQRGGPLAVYEVVAPQVAPSFWLRARGTSANLTSGAGGRIRVIWPDGRDQWYAIGRFFQPHAFDRPELKISWRGFDRAIVEVHWQSGTVTARTVGISGSVGLPADATTVAAGGSVEIVEP